MRYSPFLGLIAFASIAFASIIQINNWPPSPEAVLDGTYKPAGLESRSILKERDFTIGSLSPRDPESYPNLLDSESSLLEARQSGKPGPGLSRNFGIAMIYADDPSKAADFWGTNQTFYYFILWQGQVMLVDDGSDTQHSENFYYSFANGYNEWVATPNPVDKWMIDINTGVMFRNGQHVFGFCVSNKFPNGIGMQTTSGKVCSQFSATFKRIFFMAINRRSQLPPQSALGWFPQH